MKDPKDFKLIIMDFDGVIAKNAAHRTTIVRKVGIIEVIKRYFGLKRARKIVDLGIYEMQKKKFDEIELETKALEIINNLKGKKKAILSLNSNKIIKNFLEKFRLDKKFDKVIGIEDMKYPKPFPNSLTLLRKYFKVNKKETVYIGDSWTDYLCAKLANVSYIDFKKLIKEKKVK